MCMLQTCSLGWLRMIEDGRSLCGRDRFKTLMLAHRGQQNSVPPATIGGPAALSQSLIHQMGKAHFIPPFLTLWPFLNDHLSPTMCQKGPRTSKYLKAFQRVLALASSQSNCGWTGSLLGLLFGSSIPWCCRTISCLSWWESFTCSVWGPSSKTWEVMWDPKTFIQAAILDWNLFSQQHIIQTVLVHWPPNNLVWITVVASQLHWIQWRTWSLPCHLLPREKLVGRKKAGYGQLALLPQTIKHVVMAWD